MKKYEYLRQRVYWKGFECTMKRLGNDGWKMIHMSEDETDYFLGIFMREIDIPMHNLENVPTEEFSMTDECPSKFVFETE